MQVDNSRTASPTVAVSRHSRSENGSKTINIYTIESIRYSKKAKDRTQQTNQINLLEATRKLQNATHKGLNWAKIHRGNGQGRSYALAAETRLHDLVILGTFEQEMVE